MIGKIGCRAHDYGADHIEHLVEVIGGDGYETIQLALKKALLDVTDLKAFLTMENISHIARVMKEAIIDISVLGVYLNYGGMSKEMRDENLEVMASHILIAKAIGARMVGTETGSLDDAYSWHPDNHGEMAYLRFKEAIEGLMPLVEEADTLLAVEAVATHIIHTPERMQRLIKDVGSERLKVIFDISNLMTLDNYKNQEAMMTEMFELLEDQIVVVHVKDFDFVEGKKIILPIGEGLLNVEHLMALVKRSPVCIDILAEDVPRELLNATYKKLNSFV